MTELSPEAYERVREAVLSTARRRRRRRDFALGSVAGVAVAVVLGGAAWVVAAPAQVRERQVWCYPEADLSSVPAEGQRSPSDTVEDAAGYAVEFCAALWEAGIVGGADPAGVPDLDLCSRNDGTYAVLPRENGDSRTNEDFCATLSLSPDPRE